MIFLKEMAERLGATAQEIAEADTYNTKTQAAVALILCNFARVRAASLASLSPPANITNAATLAAARDFFFSNRAAHRACDRAYALFAHIHIALTGADTRGFIVGADAVLHRRLGAHCLADFRGHVTFREIMDAVLA